MTKLNLNFACWGYDRMQPLADGRVRPDGIDLNFLDMSVEETFFRQARFREFDISEMSLSSYTVSLHREKPPFIAIPVWPSRFFRHSCVYVNAKSGIKTPKDLAGKKMIFTAGSLEAPFLDTFLAAGGLKREQVELISVDAAAKVPSYIASRGDGVFSTVPFVIPAVAANRASDAILFADYGLQFPSFGLFANEGKLKTREVAIRKFASIVAGAWEYVLAGREDEAVQAIIAQRPQAKLDPKVLRAQIDALRDYFPSEATKGQVAGMMAEADWATGVKVMTDGKLIKGGKASDFYTNAFLDLALIKKVSGK